MGGSVNIDIGIADGCRLFARTVARGRIVVPQLDALSSERPIPFVDQRILRPNDLAIDCGL
jgi:hypothetical protein